MSLFFALFFVLSAGSYANSQIDLNVELDENRCSEYRWASHGCSDEALSNNMFVISCWPYNHVSPSTIQVIEYLGGMEKGLEKWKSGLFSDLARSLHSCKKEEFYKESMELAGKRWDEAVKKMKLIERLEEKRTQDREREELKRKQLEEAALAHKRALEARMATEIKEVLHRWRKDPRSDLSIGEDGDVQPKHDKIYKDPCSEEAITYELMMMSALPPVMESYLVEKYDGDYKGNSSAVVESYKTQTSISLNNRLKEFEERQGCGPELNYYYVKVESLTNEAAERAEKLFKDSSKVSKIQKELVERKRREKLATKKREELAAKKIEEARRKEEALKREKEMQEEQRYYNYYYAH